MHFYGFWFTSQEIRYKWNLAHNDTPNSIPTISNENKRNLTQLFGVRSHFRIKSHYSYQKSFSLWFHSTFLGNFLSIFLMCLDQTRQVSTVKRQSQIIRTKNESIFYRYIFEGINLSISNLTELICQYTTERGFVTKVFCLRTIKHYLQPQTFPETFLTNTKNFFRRRRDHVS